MKYYLITYEYLTKGRGYIWLKKTEVLGVSAWPPLLKTLKENNNAEDVVILFVLPL